MLTKIRNELDVANWLGRQTPKIVRTMEGGRRQLAKGAGPAMAGPILRCPPSELPLCVNVMNIYLGLKPYGYDVVRVNQGRLGCESTRKERGHSFALNRLTDEVFDLTAAQMAGGPGMRRAGDGIKFLCQRLSPGNLTVIREGDVIAVHGRRLDLKILAGLDYSLKD